MFKIVAGINLDSMGNLMRINRVEARWMLGRTMGRALVKRFQLLTR